MAENMKKEEQRRQNRRRRRIILGVVVAFLVIFGTVSLVQKMVRGTMNLFDDTEERKEYEERVKTLVMLDAIPFESLEKADDTVLLQACIWDVLFNEDITKFKTDENGAYLVPIVDIDRYAAKLFGPGFQFKHRTFTASEDYMEFKYNEDSQTYTMPITSMTNNFTPKVVKIQKEKHTKRVTVGYLAPPADLMTNLGSKGTASEEPVKYYDYIFTRVEDAYYLTAITESEMKPAEKPDSSSSAPQLGEDLYVPEAGEKLTENDQTPIDTTSKAEDGTEEETGTEAGAEPAAETEQEADTDADSDSDSGSDSDSDSDSDSSSQPAKKTKK